MFTTCPLLPEEDEVGIVPTRSTSNSEHTKNTKKSQQKISYDFFVIFYCSPQIVKDIKSGTSAGSTYKATATLVTEHTHVVAIGVTKCSFKGSACTCSAGTMPMIHTSGEGFGYFRVYWGEFDVPAGTTVTLNMESIPYSQAGNQAIGNMALLICY